MDVLLARRDQNVQIEYKRGRNLGLETPTWGWTADVHLADTTKKIGRGAEIRTPDLLVPNQALYQAEPRPE